MKQILLTASLILPLSALPPAAQEAEGDVGEGFSLMEEGARMLLRGLLDEAGPAIDEMESFAEDIEPALRSLLGELGPAFAELTTLIDEIGNYEAPEILPNGDIIIRRSPDAPAYVAPDGEVEL